MNNQPMSYRQYLQYHADNHPGDVKRAEAKALLGVVGDDRNLDGNFLTGTGTNRKGEVTGEQLSNGFSASAINRTVNPWWSNSYTKYLKANPIKDPNETSGGGVSNDDAKNRAYLDNELGRFDSYFGDVDRSRDVKLGRIENDYNTQYNRLGQAWADAQEDHNTATNQRLRDRARNVGVADDDFKRQNDAYSRYFSRIGSGSSSAAQYTVPTLLAKAAGKVRNEVEDKNAENAQLQATQFNRAKRGHETSLSDLLTQRQNQTSQAESDWSKSRGALFDQQANLQRQRDAAAGKSHSSVIAGSQGLVSEADRLRREAIEKQAVSPEFKVQATTYDPAIQKDWSYGATKTEVKDNNPDEDNIYNRYYRDEEDRKKQNWITATSS